MRLSFLGTGYVGLVSGACMAEIGHTVVCADVDKAKIAKLKKGVIPIYEIGLEEVVERNVKEGRLSFTTDLKEAIQSSDVVFMAVGTPEDPVTGEADLKYVFSAAEAFGRYLNGYKLFVDKSTVPVGTAEKVTRIIKEASKGKYPFEVVSNPEFLREGAAVKDFLNPDRIVVGTSSVRAKKVMEQVYRPIVRAGRPLMLTDVRSAEIIKYAANSFLAMKITFINEVANFCESAGGNVKEVARGLGYDNRIGSRFLYAGIGYGGSCFPKDVKAFIKTGHEFQSHFRLLEMVDEVNTSQRLRPFVKLKELWGEKMKDKTVAVWGLAFKPRTDDVREAAALMNISELLDAGAKVRAFDPVAMENAAKALSDKNLTYVKKSVDALKGADALIIATEWDEFRVIDYAELKKRMKGDIVYDGRNVLERVEAEAAGFTYYGVGV
ncbi:MAG: UDP-glucose/GDP-mannose dehydrogenase family protein [Candidatus Moraniibacteriota bacterium]|nr:MAG: UDP-glucose/GDP-mannose dehydrogenase family protein [Candidatus Moranbacteria bacterium]